MLKISTKGQEVSLHHRSVHICLCKFVYKFSLKKTGGLTNAKLTLSLVIKPHKVYPKAEVTLRGQIRRYVKLR